MHRMGVYLGLVEDDEYADYADRADRGDRTDRDAYPPERGARHEEYPDSSYQREKRPDGGVARRPREFSREYADTDNVAMQYEEYPQPTYQITALHPRTYNEARTIGEHFRKSTPVIMNLSDMDDADAKRLVDFAAGLTFGLHGRIERVTAKVFLLSPHNVSVTAQDKAKIESGFFNQS